MIFNKMITQIFSVLSLLIGIFSNSHACQILLDNPSVQHIFNETFENHTAGTKLPGRFRLKNYFGEKVLVKAAKSSDEIAKKYIMEKVDQEQGYIEFYLRENRTLREYRQEVWKPSLEYEFGLSCSKSGDNTQIYTYLLSVIDENLYQPQFDSSFYEIQLNFSFLHGFRATNHRIHVVDQDFNLNYANVSIICVGDKCPYFSLNPIFIDDKNGYNYSVDIKVNETALEELMSVIENGTVWTLGLIATDGKYKSMETPVNISIFEQDSILTGRRQTEGDDTDSPYLTYIIIGAGLIVIMVLCLGAAIAFYKIRSNKAKDLVRKLTEAEIREFLQGNASIGVGEGKRSVDVNMPIMAKPYNKTFEIQRDKLRVDETTILGTGAFGIVCKGSVVYSNGESITVAIKTVKRNVGILYFKALLTELKIMAYIGIHPNIVSLVGACTHNIRKREVYIALQYCPNGNFHNYLKCRRDRFSNLVVDGNLQLTNLATYSFTYSSKGCFSKTFSTLDLLQWATQIANGLQYLESLGVIHGDLATRNVLLDSDRVAKIADFGLSRRLIDYSNYYCTKSSQTPLPWKWMAPETLKDNQRFSKKSDIWSFGIVLWEVFTLAQTPYPGLNWSTSFVDELEKGLRPNKPKFASDSIYEIMVDCWNLQAHDRPEVFDIKRILENITQSALNQRSDLSYMKILADTPALRPRKEKEQYYLEPNDPMEKIDMDTSSYPRFPRPDITTPFHNNFGFTKSAE